MARSLCALNLPLELRGSDARCQSAATHPTDRLLRLQTFLQACRAKACTSEATLRLSRATVALRGPILYFSSELHAQSGARNDDLQNRVTCST